MSDGKPSATCLSACAVAALPWIAQIAGAAQVNYRNAVLGDGAAAGAARRDW